MGVGDLSEVRTTPAGQATRPAASQLSAFVGFCEQGLGRSFRDHAEFHDFSVSEWRRFWELFLGWSVSIREGPPDPVCVGDECEHAVFFPGCASNYAENLLRVDSPEDADAPALVARHPSRPADRLSRAELRRRVTSLAVHLRRLGVEPGDRVIAIAGNNAEVVIGALATAAVGATFSSAADDMGAAALLSRFEQLAPKLLMANLDEAESATPTALSGRIEEVVSALPSLEARIALDHGPAPAGLRLPVERLSELITLSRPRAVRLAPAAVQPSALHPLLVGDHGPTQMHRPRGRRNAARALEGASPARRPSSSRDALFHTSAAWMMWHWQLSALASGSQIVLYDGPLAGPETLWRLVSEEGVEVFGTGPPYLQLCEDSGLSPAVTCSCRAPRRPVDGLDPS